MPRGQYDIDVVGHDQASSVMEGVAKNTESSMGRVTKSVEKVKYSTKDLITSFSGVATSAYGMYLSYDRVVDMSMQVDRANIAVKTTTEALEKAQANYDKVLAETPDDLDAVKQAQDLLTIAQERSTLAQTRAKETAENQQQAMSSFYLMLIPQSITMVEGLTKGVKMLQSAEMAEKVATLSSIPAKVGATVAEHAHTVAQTIGAGATKVLATAQAHLNAVMMAHPILFIVTAIGLLVGALIWAYQNVEPFRNAVDWLGRTLADFFAPAVKAVGDALGWLGGLFSGAGDAWGSFVKAVQDGVAWFLDLRIAGLRVGDVFAVLSLVIKELGQIFGSVFEAIKEAWDKTIGAIINGLGWLGSQVSGFMGTMGGAGAGVTSPGAIVSEEETAKNVTTIVTNNVVTKSATVSEEQIIDALSGMAIPRFASGGTMRHTGLAILEAGERVMPPNTIPMELTRNYKIDASQQVNINSPLVVVQGGAGGTGTREAMMAAKAIVFDALRSIRIQQTSSGALTSSVKTYSTAISTTPLASPGSVGMVGSSAPVQSSSPSVQSSVSVPTSTAVSSGGGFVPPATGGSSYVPYNRLIPMPY